MVSLNESRGRGFPTLKVPLDSTKIAASSLKFGLSLNITTPDARQTILRKGHCMEINSLKRIRKISQTTKKLSQTRLLQRNKPHQGGEGTSKGNFVPMILSLSLERTLGKGVGFTFFPETQAKLPGRNGFEVPRPNYQNSS